MKKVFVVVLMTLVLLFAPKFEVEAGTLVNEHGFSVIEDTLTELSGSWTTLSVGEVLSNNYYGVNYIIGYTTTYIGRYKIDPSSISSDLRTYVIMVKVYTEGVTTDIPGCSTYIFGLTDDLIIESNVDVYPSSIGNNISSLQPSPETTNSSTSMTLITLTDVYVHSSMSFPSNDIYVYNQTNTANKHFGIDFDYNLERTWFSKTTYRDTFTNYAFYVVEIPDGYSFKNKTHIYSRYAFKEDTVLNYFDSINNTDYYGYLHTDYYYG